MSFFNYSPIKKAGDNGIWDTMKNPADLSRNLTKDDFFSVISYLAGEYDLNARNLYSKIWYDATTGQIGKRGN